MVRPRTSTESAAPYVWDLVVLEAVRAEPNIDLYAHWSRQERLITFQSPIFLDCSGDALLGVLAGAEYLAGREARSEFNEIWAPEEGDELSLGSTILFYTKDTGRPVPFVRPSFAKDIASTSIPLNRVLSSGESGARTGGKSSAANWTPSMTTSRSATSYGAPSTGSGTTSRIPGNSTPRT